MRMAATSSNSAILVPLETNMKRAVVPICHKKKNLENFFFKSFGKQLELSDQDHHLHHHEQGRLEAAHLHKLLPQRVDHGELGWGVLLGKSHFLPRLPRCELCKHQGLTERSLAFAEGGFLLTGRVVFLSMILFLNWLSKSNLSASNYHSKFTLRDENFPKGAVVSSVSYILFFSFF